VSTRSQRDAARVVGAWDDLRVDPRPVSTRISTLRRSPSRPLVLARLAGSRSWTAEVARRSHHAGPRALLIVLAVMASAGARWSGCFEVRGRPGQDRRRSR
jgi:hypothetical protein